MKTRLLLALAFFSCEQLFGQAKVRKLPNNINLPSVNNFAPFISMDGNTLVFASDNAEDRILTMYITTKADAVNWKEPVMMPKHVNSKLNFVKGFGLSADGKTLFISSVKDGGWGGFDVYSCEAKGNGWAEPVNLGSSINTQSHEACVSLSPDGSMLFFMRCARMDVNKGEGCKIMMVRKKPNGLWDAAVELPASINAGNSQAPRMLGDGETLIFSSDKLTPSKGGMDLYLTRLVNGQWTAPVALDFANTPGDDQFASASSIARNLMKDLTTGRKSELIEVPFPPELKPKAMMKVEGKVSGPANLASPIVSVFDLKDQTKVFGGRPRSDGSFTFFLKEGSQYELSLEPEQDNYTFFSRTFDLTGDRFPISEKVEASLKAVAAGDEIDLPGLTFKPHSITLAAGSSQELRRLLRLMKGNPSLKFDVNVTLNGLLKDSVESDPDLTEIIRDTIRIPVVDTIRFAISQPTDSLSSPRDSIRTETRDSIVVKTTYHNDRSEQQAMAVVYYLVSQGISADRLTHSHAANEEAILENRKTRVKITARP